MQNCAIAFRFRRTSVALRCFEPSAAGHRVWIVNLCNGMMQTFPLCLRQMVYQRPVGIDRLQQFGC
jgi:hypothetical protein